MPRITVALAALVAVLHVSTAILAAPRRVAVLRGDVEFYRAVSLALSPWAIEMLSANEEISHSTAKPGSARELARDLRVDAVVWLSPWEQGSLLFVYDAEADHLTSRRLNVWQPLSGADAAAVALSVKTVLRTSTIAPPQERREAPSEATPTRHHLAIELGGGAYWFNERHVEVRGKLAAVFWLPALRRLGFGVSTAMGPGLNIEREGYSGRYREVMAGGYLLWRLLERQRYSADVALGATAHWAKLAGTGPPSSQASEVRRVNGSADLATQLNFKVGSRVYLGTTIGVAYNTAYQRYLVYGEPVFSPRPLTFNLTGHCGLELF